MVLGDPYEFAIFLKKIDSWNPNGDTFCNGILLFSIEGNIFPTEIMTVPLLSEILLLKTRLESLVDDEQLFFSKKEDALKKIYDITFPNDINLDNNYCYDITPNSFEEKNYFIFVIKNGHHVRILATEMRYIAEESRHDMNAADIKEVFVSSEKIDKILQEHKGVMHDFHCGTLSE